MVQRRVRHMWYLYLFPSSPPIFKECEMAIGHITRTAERDTAVDFTYPYFVTMVGIISKKPKLLPKYMAILWPFHFKVWLCLVLSLMLGLVAYLMLLAVGSLALGDKSNLIDTTIVLKILSPIVMQGKNS